MRSQKPKQLTRYRKSQFQAIAKRLAHIALWADWASAALSQSIQSSNSVEDTIRTGRTILRDFEKDDVSDAEMHTIEEDVRHHVGEIDFDPAEFERVKAHNAQVFKRTKEVENSIP
jgi:hypothetical protein